MSETLPTTDTAGSVLVASNTAPGDSGSILATLSAPDAALSPAAPDSPAGPFPLPVCMPGDCRRVYIAGPYTRGDVARNVAVAMAAADTLIRAGFAPFVPHLSHFQHMAHPQPYETWTRLDFAWLAVCDAMVRPPGDSPGADAEEAWCRAHGIPVIAWQRSA